MAVVYTKLSPYMVPYMRVKFGGEPIVIPENHSLYYQFIRSVAPCAQINRAIKNLSGLKRGEKPHAVQCVGDGDESVLEHVCNPDPETHLAIQLPEVIYRNGRMEQPNDTWRFAAHAVKPFHLKIRAMFWADFGAFFEEYQRVCRLENVKFTRKSTMEQFMLKYDIDTVYLESIKRVWLRMQLPHQPTHDVLNREKKTCKTTAKEC